MPKKCHDLPCPAGTRTPEPTLVDAGRLTQFPRASHVPTLVVPEAFAGSFRLGLWAARGTGLAGEALPGFATTGAAFVPWAPDADAAGAVTGTLAAGLRPALTAVGALTFAGAAALVPAGRALEGLAAARAPGLDAAPAAACFLASSYVHSVATFHTTARVLPPIAVNAMSHGNGGASTPSLWPLRCPSITTACCTVVIQREPGSSSQGLPQN